MNDSHGAGPSLDFRIEDAWYVACTTRELRARPLACRLLDRPLVLFRDGRGRAGTVLDRCPHRNVPLSAGRIQSGTLQCAYHGWQFDREGTCVHVPGLQGDAMPRGRAVPHHATREQDGYVWVYGRADVEPAFEPYRLPAVAGRGYTSVQRAVDAEAGLFAVLENALDVPHTAFVHRGLFRGAGARNRITAVVTRTAAGVQTEYIGEPRPRGIAARILAPQDGVVRHFDRFILPSIAQVEYAIGDTTHFIVTAACTPIRSDSTRLFATVTFRTRLPGWLVRTILDPFARRIFQQDARILRLQAQTIRHFGGAHFTSTALDLMGPQIMRAMRRAQDGKESADEPEWRREVEIET